MDFKIAWFAMSHIMHMGCGLTSILYMYGLIILWLNGFVTHHKLANLKLVWNQRVKGSP